MTPDYNNDYNNGYNNDYNNGYDNDYNHGYNNGYGGSTGGSRAMSSAAIGLGIAALLFCSTIYIAIPLACLSIIMALLSRGRRKNNSGVTAAIIMDIMAIAISAAITYAAFHAVYSSPFLKSQLENMIEYYENQLYGEDGSGDSDPSGLPEQNTETESDSSGDSDESEDSGTGNGSDEGDGSGETGDSGDNGNTFQSGGAFV